MRTAVAVTGLVIDAIQKIVSGFMGVSSARSAFPTAARSTIWSRVARMVDGSRDFAAGDEAAHGVSDRGEPGRVEAGGWRRAVGARCAVMTATGRGRRESERTDTSNSCGEV